MIKMLDPKNDVVFQKIFGMKKNKPILISFLNSILKLTVEDKIKEVEFEEKTLNVSLIVGEKLSILDLNVTTESNIHIRHMGKITSQRCNVYFESDKEVRVAHSMLLVALADAV